MSIYSFSLRVSAPLRETFPFREAWITMDESLRSMLQGKSGALDNSCGKGVSRQDAKNAEPRKKRLCALCVLVRISETRPQGPINSPRLQGKVSHRSLECAIGALFALIGLAMLWIARGEAG